MNKPHPQNNDFFRKKLGAGVLSMVLTVSVVVAVLCSSLIILAYYYKTEALRNNIQEKLLINAASAMDYILATAGEREYDVPYAFDLYAEEVDSVQVLTKLWGVYELGIATSKKGKHSRSLCAFLGAVPDQDGSSALYLSDEHRPLSIAGETLLKGNVYLPKAGIRATYIDGVGYEKEKLVNGSILESKEDLPELNASLLRNVASLLNTHPASFLRLDLLADSVQHSFLEPELLYHYSDNKIVITQKLRGQILIRSGQAITVTSEAKLEDVILVAPIVTVEEGFIGNLQIFATDAIIIGANSEMKFPSTLGIISTSDSSLIDIQQNVSYEGVILLKDDAKEKSFKLISVADKAVIRGQIYSEDRVAPLGKVYGNISCRMLYLQTPYSYFDNHLLNAWIDNSLFRSNYLGPVLWSASKKRGYIKWLY